MRLILHHLGDSGNVLEIRCTALIEARRHAFRLSRPLAIDVAAEDGPSVDVNVVEPWLGVAPGTDVLVTARALYHLSQGERERASEVFGFGAPVPAFEIEGGLDRPQEDDQRASDLDVGVTRSLVEMPIARAEEGLPRPFVLRIREGHFDDLEALLRCSDHTLREEFGLGLPAIAQLDAWVTRTTAQLGWAVERGRVRELLADGLPEPRAPIEAPGVSAAPTLPPSPVRPVLPPVPSATRPLDRSISGLASALPVSVQALETSSLPGAATRVHNVLPVQGVRTVGDLIGKNEQDMLRWKNFGHTSLENLREALIKLGSQAKAAGISAEPSAAPVSTDATMRALYLQQPLLEQLRARLDELGERMRRIAEGRTLSDDPMTLEQLGKELGVTRERVRQLGIKLRESLGADGWYARLADQRIAGLRRGRSSPLTLDALEEFDDWFAGISDAPVLFSRSLEALGACHAAVQVPGGPWIVTSRDAANLGSVKDVLRREVSGAGRSTDVDAIAREHLERLDAVELLPTLLLLLGECVDGPDGIVFDPSLVQRVKAVLDRADGPLHVRDIEVRLRQAGIEFAPNAVRGCIDRADAVNTGRSTYTLAEKLKPWLTYFETVKDEVRALMESDSTRQWSSEDLLIVFHDDNLEWAQSMPVHVVDYLLGQAPGEFRRLGRGQWCLASAETTSRVSVVEVCERVMEEAGEPIPYKELVRRARERRSMGQVLNIQWPLVRVGRGMIALGTRDLAIDNACFLRVSQKVRENLSSGSGRISRSEIAEMFERECGSVPEVDPAILARALRTSSRFGLDGALGDGLRMADLERVGAPSGTRIRGRTEVPAPQIDGGEAAPEASGEVAVEEVLAEMDAGHTLSEIAELVQAETGSRPPPAALRLRLHSTGWTQSEAGRWYPPSE